MNCVKQLQIGGLDVSIRVAIEKLDRELCDAIDDAKQSGAPIGMIVAILQAHTIDETNKMIGGN